MKISLDLIRNGNVICLTLCVCFFWLASPVKLKGQPDPASPVDVLEKKAKSEQEIAVRVTVDEVRIDAVVLNWRGRQITDLTADDFEIYQDGKRQKIVYCTYVNDYIPESDRKIPLISASAPSRDEIRRTVLFMVDDFSMSFIQLHHTRMALKNFVEKQMQPGDIVGILQTSTGFGQIFSSDKRQLMSKIEQIQWGAAQTMADCGPGG